MSEQFIGAAIQPDTESMDAARLGSGEPAVPRSFKWGRKTVEVVRLLRSWRETGPCRHGSGEQYVRRHWFEIETDAGQTMKIYFDRQPRARQQRLRWWLFSVSSAEHPGGQ